MKYLNVGCGSHYSTKSEWTNLDFISTAKDVIGHNLLNGIPFERNEFDLVYHSHVLEHFSKQEGEKFLGECFRVLKPGGVIRLAIPDLERIVREYLKFLEKGIQNPEDEMNRANYEWMLLEMYDQTVRNKGGGNMGKYLFQETILNEEFVFERIGEEGRGLRESFFKSRTENLATSAKPNTGFLLRIKSWIERQLKNHFLPKWEIDLKANELGRFRLGGEIHQWMYDRYSLSALLKSKGAGKIITRDAFTSYIPNWSTFELDGKNGIVRKPDSLFIEAIKE